MNGVNEPKEIKIIVVQATTIHQENLGDGDDGFQISTRYVLLSNSPMIYFSQEHWIKALYLCQCELEPNEYFLLNHISGYESTISFDPEKEDYVQVNRIGNFCFIPVDSDFFEPYYFINRFKTERICNILQRYDSAHKYIVDIPEENVLPKNQWDRKRPYDVRQNECCYKLDPARDSNINNLLLPVTISKNSLDLYLCIPSEYFEESNETIYYLASNIPNVIDFIPEEIRKELHNYIGCINWQQQHQGDFIKGQKITHIVKRINEVIQGWGYIGPKITFHIGNELICRYRVPIIDLFQKNRIVSLFNKMID